MNKKQLIESIKTEKLFLKDNFGVDEIGIFGSYARNEATSESDVDIFVSLSKKTLHNYIALIDYLQNKLQKKVDIVTKHKTLSSRFFNIIQKDIIYV